jgi:3-hydroxyacyl-CoA dehydrogenase
MYCKKVLEMLNILPCPLLVNMVTAGKLGVKSGEGFYSYPAGSKELVVSRRFKIRNR